MALVKQDQDGESVLFLSIDQIRGYTYPDFSLAKTGLCHMVNGRKRKHP
jgi:hypothetical protein